MTVKKQTTGYASRRKTVVKRKKTGDRIFGRSAATGQFSTLGEIHTKAGENLVVISRDAYRELAARQTVRPVLDDEDHCMASSALAALASGDEEILSADEVRTLADAPSPLYFWRSKRGYTQAALAKQAEITQPQLSRLEKGDGMRLETARRLAEALEIAIDDLA